MTEPWHKWARDAATQKRLTKQNEELLRLEKLKPQELMERGQLECIIRRREKFRRAFQHANIWPDWADLLQKGRF